MRISLHKVDYRTTHELPRKQGESESLVSAAPSLSAKTPMIRRAKVFGILRVRTLLAEGGISPRTALFPLKRIYQFFCGIRDGL